MNNLAFLIGCEKYDAKTLPDLPGVQNDLESMRRALAENCGCSDGRVFVAPDSTFKGVINFFIQKAADHKTNHKNEKIDNLYFYFSGHGFFFNEKVCMLLQDFSPFPIEYGILKQEDVIKALQSYQAKHIILILDMCLTAQQKGTEEKIINPDYIPKGMGIIIFYSCFPKQPSYMVAESQKEELGLASGSVFTQCFIEALKVESGCRTVNEISGFIKEKMDNVNRKLPIKQNPHTMLQDTSLGDVVLTIHTSVPAPSEPVIQLTPEEARAVEEFSEKIDMSDKNLCIQYGMSAQAVASELNSEIFQRLSDSNRKLEDLVTTIQIFLEPLVKIKKEFARNLFLYSVFPFKTVLTKSCNRAARDIDSVTGTLNSFTKTLVDHQIYILKDSGWCSYIDEKITSYSKEIWMYILAARYAMDRCHSVKDENCLVDFDTGADILNNRTASLQESLRSFERPVNEMKAYNAFGSSIALLIHNALQRFDERFTVIRLRLSREDLQGAFDVILEIEDSLNKIIDCVKAQYQ